MNSSYFQRNERMKTKCREKLVAFIFVEYLRLFLKQNEKIQT